MNTFFSQLPDRIDRPMPDRGRLLMVVGAVLLAISIFLPLWQIHLVAPQYQEGLDLYIYSHKLEAGNEGQDLKEINSLNHYIGMAPIEEEDFAEMTFIPFLLGGFSLLALRAAFFGKVGTAIDTLVLFVYFGTFSMWRFYYQLQTYAQNLSPDAPMDVEPFIPAMIGKKVVANFNQYGYPREGVVVLLIGTACFAGAIWTGFRSGMSAEETADSKTSA